MKSIKSSDSSDVEKHKSKGDVKSLIKALGHKDWWARSAAAEALGSIGDAKTTDPLIALLNDEALPVRLKAVQALGKIKDERAVMPLAASLNDEFQSVREATELTLQQIDSPEAQQLLSEYHKKQDADMENRCVVDDERVKLLSSSMLHDFVNETNGKWNDQEWKGLLGKIREAGYTHITDEVIERLLRATRDDAICLDETAIFSPTKPSAVAVTHTPAISITTDTICVTCKKCGQSFAIGEDALVSTFFMTVSDHLASISLSNDPGDIYKTSPTAPDLIAHLGRPWGSLNPASTQKQELAIQKINSLLKTGEPRWWRCDNCKEVQEYPKMVGTTTLTETQPHAIAGMSEASPPESVETKGSQQTVSPNNPFAKSLARLAWFIGFVIGYFLFDTYVGKRVYSLQNIIAGLLIAVVFGSMCASWVEKQFGIKNK